MFKGMNEINKLALIGGFRAFGSSIIWPFMGFALYKVYGFSLTYVSLFYLIQAFINVTASISGGIITDYFGRRRTIIISIIMSSVALFIAYIINLPTPVACLILIQSYFSSIYNVSTTTIVGDMFKGSENLVKAFSRQRVGINAGWALGPLIGGYIFSTYGFRLLLLISSLLILISIPLIRLLPEFKGKGSVLDFSVSREFVIFLIPTFLTFVIIGQLGFGILTYYTSILDFTEFQVGILFAINGVMIVFLQDLLGRIINKRIKLISLGMVIYGLGYLGIALVTNFYLASVDIAIITLAEMIVTPLSQTLANSLASQKTRGKQIGLYSMVTGIGRIAGSSLISELMNYYLYTPLILWGVISSFGFISACLYYIFLKKLKSIL
jgi:MFS family permease